MIYVVVGHTSVDYAGEFQFNYFASTSKEKAEQERDNLTAAKERSLLAAREYHRWYQDEQNKAYDEARKTDNLDAYKACDHNAQLVKLYDLGKKHNVDYRTILESHPDEFIVEEVRSEKDD